MDGPRVDTVDTDLYTIKFFPSHATFTRRGQRPRKEGRYVNGKYTIVDAIDHVPEWSLDVEDKEYLNSPHRSKISYSGYDMYRYDDKLQKTITDKKIAGHIKQSVVDFISNLMTGVKAEPRFQLQQVQSNGKKET
jgi:hypothetical protein